MNNNDGFFNMDLSQDFIEELTEQQFRQLFEILKQNYFNEYSQYEKIKGQRNEAQAQIGNGQKNIDNLEKIKRTHDETHSKNEGIIEKLDVRIKKLKDEWKQL